MLEGLIGIIGGGKMEMVKNGQIVIIPAHSRREFKNRADHNALTVNIQPVSKMITEWAMTSDFETVV